MDKISFTVLCNNHHYQFNNPVPKPSDTDWRRQNKITRERLVRYKNWQHRIRECFNAITKVENILGIYIDTNLQIVLRKGQEVSLYCKFYCYDKKRGDRLNMEKGVEDALLKQDKYNVKGGSEILYDRANPRVEIELSVI